MSLLGLILVLALGPLAYTGPTYTSDTNLNDFTNGMTFGEFISGNSGDFIAPHSPTLADIDAGLRIYGNDDTPPVIAEFGSAVSMIHVFSNIDHFGSSYDGYQ